MDARQDMVPGVPKSDGGGSSSDQNDKREGADDAPQDEGRDDGGPINTNEPPLVPGGPDSGNFENLLLSNAYISDTSAEFLRAVLGNGSTIVASKAILNYTVFAPNLSTHLVH